MRLPDRPDAGVDAAADAAPRVRLPRTVAGMFVVASSVCAGGMVVVEGAMPDRRCGGRWMCGRCEREEQARRSRDASSLSLARVKWWSKLRPHFFPTTSPVKHSRSSILFYSIATHGMNISGLAIAIMDKDVVSQPPIDLDRVHVTTEPPSGFCLLQQTFLFVTWIHSWSMALWQQQDVLCSHERLCTRAPYPAHSLPFQMLN